MSIAIALKIFKKAYQVAFDAGLKCTAHAGEVGSVENMWDALNYLPLQRIGHGVKCVDDEKMMAKLRDENIGLEICPTSNIFTKVYQDYSEHPFKTIYDYGIPVSINSDDPTFFATSINKEYEIVHNSYGLSIEELMGVTEMAIQQCFADEPTKRQLMEKLI